jgi:hypothetical protein
MESNNFSDQYLYILDSNNEDKEIEFFWYWFKEYIFRIHRNTQIDKKYFLRSNEHNEELKTISNNLNELQIEKNYIEIQNIIKNYILSISLFIINNEFNSEFNLILTYIKRWNRITKNKFKINNNIQKNTWQKHVFICIKILEKYKKNNNNISEEIYSIDYDIENNKKLFIPIMKQLINEKKYGLLDLLKTEIDIYGFIENEYEIPIELNRNLSFSKVFKNYGNFF